MRMELIDRIVSYVAKARMGIPPARPSPENPHENHAISDSHAISIFIAKIYILIGRQMMHLHFICTIKPYAAM